jgi:hypothetical protein
MDNQIIIYLGGLAVVAMIVVAVLLEKKFSHGH